MLLQLRLVIVREREVAGSNNLLSKNQNVRLKKFASDRFQKTGVGLKKLFFYCYFPFRTFVLFDFITLTLCISTARFILQFLVHLPRIYLCINQSEMNQLFSDFSNRWFSHLTLPSLKISSAQLQSKTRIQSILRAWLIGLHFGTSEHLSISVQLISLNFYVFVTATSAVRVVFHLALTSK